MPLANPHHTTVLECCWGPDDPITASEIVCLPGVDPLKHMTDDMMRKVIRVSHITGKDDTAEFFYNELARRLKRSREDSYGQQVVE